MSNKRAQVKVERRLHVWSGEKMIDFRSLTNVHIFNGRFLAGRHSLKFGSLKCCKKWRTQSRTKRQTNTLFDVWSWLFSFIHFPF